MSTTQEWHYSNNGEALGPVSTARLKELASTGELSASDLIWKDGWDNWRAAGTIKGLFDTAPPTRPVPPNLPATSQLDRQPATGNVAEAVRSDLTDFVSSAKNAKNLAVARARRMQLTQMTLPSVYLALGKDIFAGDRFREEFSDLFQRISRANDEIAKVKVSTANRPQATDIKGKLQSGAAQLIARGQTTKLGFQRESLVRELGKKAFESHGASAGSPELVVPITTATEEITKLDAQITPASSAKGVPLWQRIPLAALLTVGCFPIGLALVWLNPRLSRRSKAMWIGGVASLFICMGIIGRIGVEKAKAEFAAASQLWNSEDKPAAISRYRVLVKRHFLGIPQSERSLIIGRVIDFDAESGNELSVGELLKIAGEEQVVPTLSSQKARSLQAKLDAEQRLSAEKTRPHATNETRTVTPSDTSTTFNASEMKVISGDRRLSIAFELGHLDATKLEKYVEMKSSAERKGIWKGTTDNLAFLMILPSREWPVASRSLGLSRDEYFKAVKFMLIMAGAPIEERDATILDMTGERVEDYYSGRNSR